MRHIDIYMDIIMGESVLLYFVSEMLTFDNHIISNVNNINVDKS